MIIEYHRCKNCVTQFTAVLLTQINLKYVGLITLIGCFLSVLGLFYGLRLVSDILRLLAVHFQFSFKYVCSYV